ncbi:MAG TPA: hypothetical protein ENG03_10995 [Thioploca sp.]|nr:hypothetical protein [Thioploca sp.]
MRIVLFIKNNSRLPPATSLRAMLSFYFRQNWCMPEFVRVGAWLGAAPELTRRFRSITPCH